MRGFFASIANSSGWYIQVSPIFFSGKLSKEKLFRFLTKAQHKRLFTNFSVVGTAINVELSNPRTMNVFQNLHKDEKLLKRHFPSFNVDFREGYPTRTSFGEVPPDLDMQRSFVQQRTPVPDPEPPPDPPTEVMELEQAKQHLLSELPGWAVNPVLTFSENDHSLFVEIDQLMDEQQAEFELLCKSWTEVTGHLVVPLYRQKAPSELDIRLHLPSTFKVSSLLVNPDRKHVRLRYYGSGEEEVHRVHRELAKRFFYTFEFQESSNFETINAELRQHFNLPFFATWDDPTDSTHYVYFPEGVFNPELAREVTNLLEEKTKRSWLFSCFSPNIRFEISKLVWHAPQLSLMVESVMFDPTQQQITFKLPFLFEFSQNTRNTLRKIIDLVPFANLTAQTPDTELPLLRSTDGELFNPTWVRNHLTTLVNLVPELSLEGTDAESQRVIARFIKPPVWERILFLRQRVGQLGWVLDYWSVDEQSLMERFQTLVEVAQEPLTVFLNHKNQLQVSVGYSNLDMDVLARVVDEMQQEIHLTIVLNMKGSVEELVGSVRRAFKQQGFTVLGMTYQNAAPTLLVNLKLDKVLTQRYMDEIEDLVRFLEREYEVTIQTYLSEPVYDLLDPSKNQYLQMLQEGVGELPFEDPVGDGSWEPPLTPEEMVNRPFVNELGGVVFTVDPSNTELFDGAFTIKHLENEEGPTNLFLVGVHVADMASLVGLGSDLDLKARLKTRDAYLGDFYVKMFPKLFLRKYCSLNRDIERSTVTLWIKMTVYGKVVGWKFERTYLRVEHHLTTQLVDLTLEKGNEVTLSTELNRLHKLAHKLREQRESGGAIMLDDAQALSPAYLMVEEFTILANTIAGNLMQMRRGQARHQRVFRNQHLNSQRLLELGNHLNQIGYEIDLLSGNPREELNKVLSAFRESPFYSNMRARVIQSLGPAFYSVRNQGHWALGKVTYTSWTAPMRRYADLLAQRLMFDEGYEVADLPSLLKYINEMDRLVKNAEIRTNLEKQITEVSRKIGSAEVEGRVVWVTQDRALIQLKKLNVYLQAMANPPKVVMEEEKVVVGAYELYRGNSYAFKVEYFDEKKRSVILRLTNGGHQEDQLLRTRLLVFLE